MGKDKLASTEDMRRGGVANFGYDDDKGDYRFEIGDHMQYRFEIVQRLGRGSFGQVVKALDHRLGEHVALKIIRNKKRFHKQALVEVRILAHLRQNDPHDRKNVVKMKEHFTFRNHLCICFEMLHINLYEFLKLNNFKPVA